MTPVALPEVQVTVAVPGVNPAISVAVAVPLSSVVTVLNVFELLEKIPRFVEKVTDVPMLTGLPVEAVTTAVMTEDDILSAGMDVGLAVSVIVPGLSFSPEEDPPHPQQITTKSKNSIDFAVNNKLRFIDSLA